MLCAILALTALIVNYKSNLAGTLCQCGCKIEKDALYCPSCGINVTQPLNQDFITSNLVTVIKSTINLYSNSSFN